MASCQRHKTGEQREARRTNAESNRTGGEVTPAAVEAVIQFGYPQRLVLSIYQQLLSARAPDSRNALPQTGNGASSIAGRTSSRTVTASTLLAAVEDAIRHSNVAGDEMFGSSFADSSATPGFASSLNVTGEGDGTTQTGDLQDDGSDDDDVTSSPRASGRGQGARNGAVDHPRSSTGNQPSTSNMEGATSSTENTLVPTASSTGSQAYSETSPSLTSSDDARRDVRNPERRSATSVMTTGATPGHNAAPSPANEISTAEASRESNTAPPNQGADARPGPRDRSSDRENNTSAEDRLRERRRQLKRLRALRAENRRLKARQTCLHCRKNPVTLTLLPCGHFTFCMDCGSSFDTCPICKKKILADVKTFLS